MVDVDVIVGIVSVRVRCQIVFLFFFVMLYLCTPLNTQMTPIVIWWPAFGAPLLLRIAVSALDASCDCAWHDQTRCIGAADGPCARCAPFVTIGRLLWHLFCMFCVRSQRQMDVDVILGVVSVRVRCQIVFSFFFVMLYLCTPLNTQMTPIIILA